MRNKGILSQIFANLVSFVDQTIEVLGSLGITAIETFSATRTLFLDIQLVFVDTTFYEVTRYRNGTGVLVDSLAGGEQNLTQVYATGDTIQIGIEFEGGKSQDLSGAIYLRENNTSGRIIATYTFTSTID